MLDLGGIPLRGDERTMDHPLVIAGGPCAQNPEPLAPFIDLFVTGDGEPALPLVCDEWLQLQERVPTSPAASPRATPAAGSATRCSPEWPPRCRSPTCRGSTSRSISPTAACATLNRTRADVPETIEPSVIDDLEAMPLPAAPIVPYVECVHDRIAIEIMRGCPWQCRFCQSTVIKRPLRIREVETIVAAALEALSQHGLQRNFAALALDQRLSVLRATRAADARDVSAAGREASPCRACGSTSICKSVAALIGTRSPFEPDAGPRSRPRRHARADSQEDQERRSVRRLPRGVRQRLRQGEAVFPVRPAGRAARSISTASSTWPRRSPRSAGRSAGAFRR